MSTFAHAMRRVIRRGADSPAVEAAAADGRARRSCRRRSLSNGAGGRDRAQRPAARLPPDARRRDRGRPARARVAGRRRPPRRRASSLIVPLVSGGELIGTLNLGPRLSDQQYSTDDKRLLDSLAAQAAPALQVAELVRRQASRGGVARAHRAGAPRRAADPAELPAARAARSSPAGTSTPTTSRPARWAATSTTSSTFPTARSASSSAT